MNASQIEWGGGHEQSHTNVFILLHRLLRGKYILTVVLAVVFGISGGVLGFVSQKPQYRSVGMIRIQPSLPKVLYESEQSTAPKMFSSFVSSQAKLISEGGVILRALESQEWRAVEHLSNIEVVSDVQRRLDVKPDRRAQEIITVAFSDANPQVSSAIVRSVMKSYHEQYAKEGSISNPEILNALNSRLDKLKNDRLVYDSQIANLTRSYRTENLSPLIQSAQLAILQLEANRNQLIENREYYREFQKDGELGDEPLTVEEAASMDPMTAEMVTRKNSLVDSREEMMASEGLREEHRDVRRITAMIDSLDSKINTRISELQKGGRDTLLVDGDGLQIPSEDELTRRIARIDAQIREAKENSEDLFEDSVQLDTLRIDRDTVQSSITRVVQRLDQIRTESQVENMEQIDGKISISLPTPAKDPTSDPRIKMAALGFIGAGSLPILAVLGLGYFSHKIQYSDDDILAGENSGIVGMLPDLGNSLADKELAAASAFAVHQIRSQLQIKNHLSEPRIYGVTSPAPQDGKTSLIIALGLSFAESGNRTLLVDLDFIGRGLSVHFGYPNAPSLADSLNSHVEIRSLIQETSFEGLSILPAGFGDDERVSRLSPRTVSSLFELLRSEYDTVLVDTGPILGSVEAAFVSPQADGVIVVVGRGQFKPLVKKAFDHIHAVDGRVIATVFNRASIQELRQSSSSMSVHFSRQVSRQQEDIAGNPNLHVGPVAGALFSSLVDQNESTKDKSGSK
tara:strand:+ start:321956 stop:324181 length:2226 start_codon:yes stop_codon:yes gene_type:complete